jgi:hypothetical protein
MKKKGGRPRLPEAQRVNATQIGLRLPPDLLKALDAWIDDEQIEGLRDYPRPEAIRRIVTAFLRRRGYLPKV